MGHESEDIRDRMRKGRKLLPANVTEEDPNNLLMVRDGRVRIDLSRQLGDKTVSNEIVKMTEGTKIDPAEVKKMWVEEAPMSVETELCPIPERSFMRSSPGANPHRPQGWIPDEYDGVAVGVSQAPLMIDTDKTDKELMAMGIPVAAIGACNKCGAMHDLYTPCKPSHTIQRQLEQEFGAGVVTVEPSQDRQDSWQVRVYGTPLTICHIDSTYESIASRVRSIVLPDPPRP